MNWLRRPQRLAHLASSSESIHENGRRIGTRWTAHCGRWFTTRWDHEAEHDWVDPIELRDEIPRGWCLRCGYRAALEAMVLPERGFESFVAQVYRGRMPEMAAKVRHEGDP